MKAVEIHEAFGIEHLVVTERTVGEPGPNELLLRMEAASLNYRDLLTVRGHYNPRQPLPLIPCSDGVGVVEAVGPGCSRFAVGQRVCPIFCQSWVGGPPTTKRLRSTLGGPLDGTLTQQMVVHEQSAVAVPEHLDSREAACLPCAAVTAWSALVKTGAVTAGDTVLVLGSGGVALFALQIAKALGARVIATSSSETKLQRLTALGADAVINYRDEPRWGRRVRELTSGRGVDHVIELGGAGTLSESLRAVRVGGQISLIGVLSGTAAELNILPILMQQVRLQGILVGSRDDFEDLCRAMTAHQLHPIIEGHAYCLDTVPDAFEHMASGRHFGKIVIDLT